jgi:hypothetical protein
MSIFSITDKTCVRAERARRAQVFLCFTDKAANPVHMMELKAHHGVFPHALGLELPVSTARLRMLLSLTEVLYVFPSRMERSTARFHQALALPGADFVVVWARAHAKESGRALAPCGPAAKNGDTLFPSSMRKRLITLSRNRSALPGVADYDRGMRQ